MNRLHISSQIDLTFIHNGGNSTCKQRRSYVHPFSTPVFAALLLHQHRPRHYPPSTPFRSSRSKLRRRSPIRARGRSPPRRPRANGVTIPQPQASYTQAKSTSRGKRRRRNNRGPYTSSGDGPQPASARGVRRANGGEHTSKRAAISSPPTYTRHPNFSFLVARNDNTNSVYIHPTRPRRFRVHTLGTPFF